MALISVIVPVYKVEMWLRRCIDSILAQTFSDFELILVDDGSPDNCPQICDEYARRDSRVKVIHQKNGGLSAARNTGLDITRGKYITFVDSDDWIDSDFLEVLFRNIVEHDAQICQCNFRFSFEDGTAEIPSRNTAEISFLNKSAAIHSLFDYDWNGFYIPVWGKLYSSTLFKNVRFKPGRIHEDNFMSCDIVVRGDYERIVVLQCALYNYFQRTGGLATEWKDPKEIEDKFAAHLYFLNALPAGSPELLVLWRNGIRGHLALLLRWIKKNDFVFPADFYMMISQILQSIPMTWIMTDGRKIYRIIFFIMRFNVKWGIFVWQILSPLAGEK